MKKGLLISIAVVLVVGILGFVILSGSGGDKAMEGLLTKYFTAYFQTANVEDAKACVAEDLKEEAEMAFTLGGTMNMLINNKQDLMLKLGEGYTIAVTAEKINEPSAQSLNQYKSKITGVTMVRNVDFLIELTGDQGSVVYTGTVPMAKVGGNWYIAQYAMPIYEKSSDEKTAD